MQEDKVRLERELGYVGCERMDGKREVHGCVRSVWINEFVMLTHLDDGVFLQCFIYIVNESTSFQVFPLPVLTNEVGECGGFFVKELAIC